MGVRKRAKPACEHPSSLRFLKNYIQPHDGSQLRYHDSTPEASRQLSVFLSPMSQSIDEYIQRDRKSEDGQPSNRQKPPITCALERFCLFGYGYHIQRLSDELGIELESETGALFEQVKAGRICKKT